jgi:hypothetical protein
VYHKIYVTLSYGFHLYVSYHTFTFTFIQEITNFLKQIPFVGWVLELLDDAITSAIEALFDGIGIEIPSFGLDVPFLDNLDRLVEDAKKELQEFLDFFTSIMDMDGEIDDLIEPIISAIQEAIPSVDFDLGCIISDDISDDISDNPEECFFDVLRKFVKIPSTNLTIPELSIGGLNVKLPKGLTSIADTLTNEIESIMDGILNLFEDVECDRYETLRINIPEFIEDTLTNFTTSAFPIPNCPINVEVCTNLRLPGLETFYGGINDIISRRNRQLSVDTTSGFRRLLCEDRWSEEGPP